MRSSSCGRVIFGAVALVAAAAAWQVGPAGGAPSNCAATAFVAITNPANLMAIDLKTGQQSGDLIPLPPAGVFIQDTATSPDGKTVYAVMTGLAQLAKVDVATRAMTGTVDVGSGPQAVAVTPDGSRLLVVNYDDATVTVIDAATFTTVGAPLAVGTGPSAVSVTHDGSTAFVSNTPEGTMSVIDLATLTVEPAKISVGVDPIGMAFTPDGSTLYVANRQGNTPTPDPTKSGKLSKIDVATRTVAADVSGFEMPAGVAITADGTVGYVTNYGGGYVSSFETATGAIRAKTHPMTGGPYDIKRTPDDLQMYVARTDAAALDIIDIASDTVVGELFATGPVAGPSFTQCQVTPPTTTTTVAPTTTTTVVPTPSVTPVNVSPQFVG